MSHWSSRILNFKFLRSTNFFRNYSKDKRDKNTSLSYWYTRGDFQFSSLTVGEVVDKAADKFGDNDAISVPFQNINKTFTQFKKDVDQLAAGLIGLGMQKNERIAIWSPNNYEWVFTQFAALKAGLILVSLNPAFRAVELEYALNKVKCKAIITAEYLKSINLYDTICEVMPEILNSNPGQLCSEKVKCLQHVITLTNKSLPGTYNFKEIFNNDGSENVNTYHERQKEIQFDDMSTIMFTSGTTGSPKAATASHFQYVNQGIASGRRMGFDKELVVICLQVPLFHSYGYAMGLITTLQYGGKCVIPSQSFHSPSSLESIQNERCTFTYGVPTMYFDMLKHLSDSNYDLTSWKKAVIGAAPVAEYLIKEMKSKFDVEVVNGYGSTESIAAISLGNSATDKYSGKPIEHTEVKIVDKNGDIVPVNTKGEILCRAPYTFLGYWNNKEKTTEIFDNTRWYHSGDIGSMDEYGNIHVTGRIKDMVIRGGVNIYPQEIENFLITHPAISEAYVVGIPDERMGEELCACIQIKHNQRITDTNIKDFCKGKISYFKIPKYILLFEDFPKTESGKIKKFLVQEQCVKLLKL